MQQDFSSTPQIVDAPFIFRGFTGWPTFCPDGKSIVFTNDADLLQCYLVRVDLTQNNKSSQLTNPGIGAKRPSFHPNGNHLAYNLNNESIWLLDIATKSSAPYISNELRVDRKLIHPCFAPDGSSIVVASYQRNGPQREEVLYRISPELGGYVQVLTQYPQVCAGRPAVSPDNKSIIFAGHAGSFNQVENRLWIVEDDLESRMLEIGEDSECHGRCPGYSPDGRWVACVSARPEKHPNEDTKLGVWIISTDGTQSFKLTSGKNKPTHMCWSPDQKKLAVTGAYGLQLIELPDIFYRM